MRIIASKQNDYVAVLKVGTALKVGDKVYEADYFTEVGKRVHYADYFTEQDRLISAILEKVDADLDDSLTEQCLEDEDSGAERYDALAERYKQCLVALEDDEFLKICKVSQEVIDGARFSFDCYLVTAEGTRNALLRRKMTNF